MNTAQKSVIGIALAALAGLYFLGKTVGPKPEAKAPPSDNAASVLDFDKMKMTVMGQLTPARQQYVTALENSVKRGDVQAQQETAYRQLAGFWKDSVANPVLHYQYTALLSELVNTEKSLTFAAHSILGYLPYAHNVQEQVWLANRGKLLFDKALSINAQNDSSRVGLGGCIMYGATSTEGPMAGILKVREVAEKDSSNQFAQYMLGIGGMISGQYDKAAVRFEKVAALQPNNLEVMFKLAEAYELSKNNPKALEWYQTIQSKVGDPAMKAEIGKRMEQLKNEPSGK